MIEDLYPTPMIRDAFEAWCREHGRGDSFPTRFREDPFGHMVLRYESGAVQEMWEIWLASHKIAVVEGRRHEPAPVVDTGIHRVTINGVTYVPLQTKAVEGATLGQALRLRRKRYHESMGEVAQACGLSKAYLWTLERDRANPSLHVIAKLAFHLGLPLDSLAQLPNHLTLKEMTHVE